MKLKCIVTVATLLLLIGIAPSWGQQAEDPLIVVPEEGYTNMVEEDAEIIADSKRYTLINNGTETIQYRVEWSADWFTVTPDRGDIPAQSRTNIELRISPDASEMPQGVYTDTIVITNILTRVEYERDVRLDVTAEGTGAVSVIILPNEAAQAGAQWRISNVSNLWRSSGDVLTGLPPGYYTITFRAVDDYITPLDLQVTPDDMEAGQVAVFTAIYQTVALAGLKLSVPEDMTIPPDNPSVILEGAASGGEMPYEFRWSVARRPVGSGLVNFSQLTDVQTKVSAALSDPVVEGNYEILLQATDSDGRIVADTVTIKVDEEAPGDTEDEEPPMDTDEPSDQDGEGPIVPDVPSCAPMTMPMLGLALCGIGLLGVLSRRKHT
jgi:hypothetical protein